MDRNASSERRPVWRAVVIAVAVLAVVGGITYSVLVNARDTATEPASNGAVAQQVTADAAAQADQPATSQHDCQATCGRSPKSCGSKQSTSCDPSACGH